MPFFVFGPAVLTKICPVATLMACDGTFTKKWKIAFITYSDYVDSNAPRSSKHVLHKASIFTTFLEATLVWFIGCCAIGLAGKLMSRNFCRTG
jgi:hypothetical protein